MGARQGRTVYTFNASLFSSNPLVVSEVPDWYYVDGTPYDTVNEFR